MNDRWENSDERNQEEPSKIYEFMQNYLRMLEQKNQEDAQSNLEFDSFCGNIPSLEFYQQNSRSYRSQFNNNSSVEISVLSSMVGKIIGRRGSKIKELQEKSNTRIVVTKKKIGNQTVLKLYGNKLNKERAINMIRDYIRVDNYNGDGQMKMIPALINWRDLKKQCASSFVLSVKQDIQIITERDYDAVEKEKLRILVNWLQMMESTDKVIIYCNRRDQVDYLTVELSFDSFNLQCLHGGRKYEERKFALKEFSTGRVKILIATDLASRGLDIKGITHIINYDLPKQLEYFVHRITKIRWTRQERVAISYVSRWDWARAGDLVKILRMTYQHVPYELIAMARRYKQKYQKKD